MTSARSAVLAAGRPLSAATKQRLGVLILRQQLSSCALASSAIAAERSGSVASTAISSSTLRHSISKSCRRDP